MATNTLPHAGNVIQFPAPPKTGDGDGDGPDVLEVRIILEGLDTDQESEPDPEPEPEPTRKTRVLPFIWGVAAGLVWGG